MSGFNLPVGAVSEFAREGAVRVRWAFTPEQVALVERGVERNLADPNPLSLVTSDPCDPGTFVEDFRNWTRIDDYVQFTRESSTASIAQQLMPTTTVRLRHDHMLTSTVHTRQRTLWHQCLLRTVDHAPDLQGQPGEVASRGDPA